MKNDYELNLSESVEISYSMAEKNKLDFICIHKGMCGYTPVLMTWGSEEYPEPWTTHVLGYMDKQTAKKWAKDWAYAQEMHYVDTVM